MIDEVIYLDENHNMVINGKPYALITTGRQQAIQVQGLTKWIARHGSSILTDLQNQEELGESDNGIQFILDLVGQLDADALIDFFQALSGCTTEEAELYFDAAVLIEAVIVVYENHPTVRRLFERFFSTQDSEEEKQPESSTTSE